jgi:LPS-assembly protein
VRGLCFFLFAIPGAAWTQEQGVEPPLQLRPSRTINDAITPEQRDKAPVFLLGDRLQTIAERTTVLQGRAQLRKPGTVISADRLEYDQVEDRATASGNVLINRGGNVYQGPQLELRVEAFEGFFEQPRYQFFQNEAHGQASRADFLDATHAVVHQATYTTCKRLPGPDWMPAWILRATSIELDTSEEVGVAHGAVLSFQGLPILPVPAISFPLTEKRKSGLLPVTVGVDSLNGTELSVPYYWNIAPNRDATITPTNMSLRGVDLGAELRYLEPWSSGVLRANYMASDQLRQSDRWGVAMTQSGLIDTGIPAVGLIGLDFNFNRVSDDNYWRDFTRSSATLTQRLLPSDVRASWGRGGFSTGLHLLKWQTLQDPSAPILPPFDRMPQVTSRYEHNVGQGSDWSLEGDFTRFQADPALTLQSNALRIFALGQISRPWIAPQGFVTPKLQWHASSYQFDTPLSNGAVSADSIVPTFSLDSGLVFERDASLWGLNIVQTLEPRAFYVYTPYRNQSHLPNYDTGNNDFNFASIYTENAFVGHDKIADNNLLTLGLTSRYLDSQTGAQLARFGIAQRFRFEDQRVTLNSSTLPGEAGFSDVLLGAAVNVFDRWTLDSTVQYNAKTDQSVRSTLAASYNPGNYRVLNTAYRFQRGLSEQVDVSWQWPLNDLWSDSGVDMGAGRGQGAGRYYSVGRLNYSLDERRLVDTIMGVEYDAGCWLGRVVLQRVQTSNSTSTQNLIFQLEFVGFTRLGVGSQKTLTQNISRYQNLRESGGLSSRLNNYD